MLDVVHEDTSLGVLREVMRNFYSPLKDSDRMLRHMQNSMKTTMINLQKIEIKNL